MSSGPLPERVDALRLFASGASIQGSVSAQRVPRLLEYLASDSAVDIEVALQFERNEANRRHLQGQISAQVSVPCQRCLEPLPLQVDSELDIIVVGSERELAALGDEADSLLCSDDTLDLTTLVEDEVILSLPLAPRHEREDCNAALLALKEQAAAQPEGSDEQAGSNAFAQLQALKGTLDK